MKDGRIGKWTDLNAREKKLVIGCVVERKKLDAVASELGISTTWLDTLIRGVYRVLNVEDIVDLAFWVGRNWKVVKKDVLRRTSR